MDSWMAYALYIIAYGTAIAAFSFNSIFWLRMFTVISSFCYVLYYYIFPVEPLWMDVVSEGALVSVNVFMIVNTWNKNRKLDLTFEEKEIYNGVFSSFSPFGFYKLIRAGHWQNLQPGVCLTCMGEELDSVFFIYNGSVDVRFEGSEGFQLADGYFLGEMSISVERWAAAEVYVAAPSRIISWKKKDLEDLLSRNPAMRKEFEAVVTQDLMRKLKERSLVY
ncbi:MAG: cyclic nucleotide-binding domain-containing protein [Saprospiraceae bacterium]